MTDGSAATHLESVSLLHSLTSHAACGLQEATNSSGKGVRNPLGLKKAPRSPEPEVPRGLGVAGGRPPRGSGSTGLDDLGIIPATPRLTLIASLRSRRPSSEDGALTGHLGALSGRDVHLRSMSMSRHSCWQRAC